MKFYAATRDSHEFLVVVEKNNSSPRESPLHMSDPVKGERPLFVLSHPKYSIGDKDAFSLGWTMVKSSLGWEENWMMPLIRNIHGESIDNPQYIDNSMSGLFKAAHRVGAMAIPVYGYEQGESLCLTLNPFETIPNIALLGILLWTRELQPGDARNSNINLIAEQIFQGYRDYVLGDIYSIRLVHVDEELCYLGRKNYCKSEVALSDLYYDDVKFCSLYGDTISRADNIYGDIGEQGIANLLECSDIEELKDESE